MESEEWETQVVMEGMNGIPWFENIFATGLVRGKNQGHLMYVIYILYICIRAQFANVWNLATIRSSFHAISIDRDVSGD